MDCDDFSFFLCFLCLGDAKEDSVDEEEEEELLLLVVEEAAWVYAWLYASLGCIISAAVLFSGRPLFLL